MKPTFQISDASKRRDSFASSRKRPSSPQTDYHFQPPSANFPGRCQGEGGPSFRKISRDYFQNEARAHFASEALIFGVIAITAAVPIFEGIRGLAQFVYGIL
ncbi:MAG TPA: hypothetical protein VK474_13130 [Chthoniobacterales bacterium]|nr:hypothetical protein [Chthoniobacterales bacterium]